MHARVYCLVPEIPWTDTSVSVNLSTLFSATHGTLKLRGLRNRASGWACSGCCLWEWMLQRIHWKPESRNHQSDPISHHSSAIPRMSPLLPKNTVPTIPSEERKLRLREVRTLQTMLLFPVAHLSCTRFLKAAGLEDMRLWASEKLSCTG